MFGKIKKVTTNYQRNITFTAFSALGLLFLCFMFLFLHFDRYADMVAAFIYFVLVIMVVLQVFEQRYNPHSFVVSKSEIFETTIGKSLRFLKDFSFTNSYDHRYHRLQKFINTFIVVLFFLIYGVSTPRRENIPGFIFLVLLLLLANIALFYYNFGDTDKQAIKDLKFFVKAKDKKLYNFFAKHISKKENLMIGTVNACMLAMFVIFFGLDVTSYFKFAAIAFILILINSALLADIRNGKLYG